jgi:hypothetical protein
LAAQAKVAAALLRWISRSRAAWEGLRIVAPSHRLSGSSYNLPKAKTVAITIEVMASPSHGFGNSS